MTLDDWAALAAKEQDSNLHAFNYRREQAYGLASLAPAYQAFAAFLSPIALTDNLKADQLLVQFVELQKIAPGSTDLRYSDPGLSNDSRQVFLKSLGIHEIYLTRIGFDPARVQAAAAEIQAAMMTRDLDEALEEELQDRVDGLAPRLADDDELEQQAYQANGGDPGLVPRPVDYGRDPWWFTYEFALQDEEQNLPDRSSPLQRSGYVAGMRAGLGLFHKTDADNDNAVAAREDMIYRLYFQLAATIPSDHANQLNQPRLFSEGSPRLFLTNPKSTWGGRTVRLQLVDCAHPDMTCQCADEGLPEGVMPAYVPMDGASEREVRGLYLILHRDLSRYEPPSCSIIRARRSGV